jgi:hypothetical protein
MGNSAYATRRFFFCIEGRSGTRIICPQQEHFTRWPAKWAGIESLVLQRLLMHWIRINGIRLPPGAYFG